MALRWLKGVARAAEVLTPLRLYRTESATSCLMESIRRRIARPSPIPTTCGYYMICVCQSSAPSDAEPFPRLIRVGMGEQGFAWGGGERGWGNVTGPNRMMERLWESCVVEGEVLDTVCR